MKQLCINVRLDGWLCVSLCVTLGFKMTCANVYQHFLVVSVSDIKMQQRWSKTNECSMMKAVFKHCLFLDKNYVDIRHDVVLQGKIIDIHRRLIYPV